MRISDGRIASQIRRFQVEKVLKEKMSNSSSKNLEEESKSNPKKAPQNLKENPNEPQAKRNLQNA